MTCVAAHPQRIGQRGFSLLELLVAFTIMAMSLGLLYRMAGGSARSVTDAVQNQQVVWLAESLLASRRSVLVDGWNEDGEIAGFKWQVRSVRQNSGANTSKIVPMHKIQLTISWSAAGRLSEFSLVTLLPERPAAPGAVVR